MTYRVKLWTISVVFSAAQLLAAALFILKKQLFNTFEAILLLLIFMAFLIYNKKKGMGINPYTLAFAVLTVTAHDFIGRYLNLYNTNHYFDKLLHIWGSLFFSLLFYSILHKSEIILCTRKSCTFILILLLGTSFGAMFELLEFGIDVISHGHNQKGLLDTDLDLLSNMIGAVMAACYWIFRYPKKTRR